MDASFVGRSFPLPQTYVVGVEKVREFADAIGERSPLCHDRVAARAAGYPDLVAPPTFAIAAVARAQDVVLFDPSLGLDFSRVVHGDQAFTHYRPICAGDELSAVVHIDAIRRLGDNDILTVRTELTDHSGDHEGGHDGAPVCTAVATLVARGTAS